MKYISYNTQSDGAGSQIQRIFSIYVIAKQFNLHYIHSPFHTTEHDFDPSLVNRFNQFIELPSDPPPLPEQYQIIVMDSINRDTLPLLQREYPIATLFKINVAHEYLNDHPELLDPLFPYPFPWIETKVGTHLKIAIHIRRGDVSPNENSSRYVPFLFYLECIEYLSQLFHPLPHQFAIYSESTLYPELTQYQERLNQIPDVSYHIDEDIIQTFQSLVNADVLVAGHSSLSFSATMLKQKGITIHLPFCCIYSKKHIEIHSPHELSHYKTQLFQSIGPHSLLQGDDCV
jgi:hypothetical protein